LIENGKPMGVVLTMEEFEKLKENKKATPTLRQEQPELLMSDINTTAPYLPTAAIDDFGIGEAMLKEMDLPNVKMDELNFASSDDITLEDLGLDEITE